MQIDIAKQINTFFLETNSSLLLQKYVNFKKCFTIAVAMG